MLQALRDVLERTMQHLAGLGITYVPRILAGAIVLAVAAVVAAAVRRMLLRLVHATTLERFLAQSGLSDLLSRSGQIRAARLIANASYWGLMIAGVLAALSAADTQATTQLVDRALHFLPRMAAAAAIILAGVWLARYFGHGMLVWACNEDLPCPRRLATVVRVLVVFGAVVIAADELEFAPKVFLAAFLIVFGGLMLTAAIAAGSAMREITRRRLEKAAGSRETEDEALWRHV